MKKISSPKEAVSHIHDGAVLMIGGFMCCGQPLRLIEELLKQGAKGLTVITNDAGFPERGVGKLVVAGRVRRLVASHIGLNPVAGQRMHSGAMAVDLIPQGTLAERIRCAGAGLGGILTPTGLGTEAESGKRKIDVDGRKYILETPLKADFALVKVSVCDRCGNGFIAKAAKNFNPLMAMAAQHTIAEADELVEIGALDPERVTLPGVFVNTVAFEVRR
ncbi:MAG TPA: branched-chain amino acid dehydrogenase [Elusimicrobia bacterium]|nr:branched-chain amino acid dehydrogenase [Elusimicrobiota bacterium]HBT61886.1 branched-chain amino acid dehydrogenase [Elusimicrobiota bacterium]